MHDVPHFQEARRKKPVSSNDRLPDAIYSTALDFLVFACLDLVFTHQPPKHHGSHSLNVTYQIELTSEEKEQVRLRSDEYDTWQWINVDSVGSLLKTDDALGSSAFEDR